MSGDAPINPGLANAGASLDVRGTLVGGSISRSAKDGFKIETQAGPLSIGLQGVSAEAGSVSVVVPDVAVFANVMRTADLIVRPTAIGMDSFIQVRDESAPRLFSWIIALRGSQRLAFHEGAVDVTNGEGKVVAGFQAPTATDANGAVVPTGYSVTGDKLTMSIGHRGNDTAYPVVAEAAVAATGQAGEWNVFAPRHTVSPVGLGQGRLDVIHGSPDGNGGCEFAGTSYTESGTATEDRELAIAPQSCRVLAETGVPPASVVDAGQAEPGTTESSGGGGMPAAAQPASAAHVSNVRHNHGYYKSIWEDPIGLDVAWVRQTVDWYYNGSCVTRGWWTGDYHWLSDSGWYPVVKPRTTGYVMCAGDHSHSGRSGFKNTTFCTIANGGEGVEPDFAVWDYVNVPGRWRGGMLQSWKTRVFGPCSDLLHYDHVRKNDTL